MQQFFDFLSKVGFARGFAFVATSLLLAILSVLYAPGDLQPALTKKISDTTLGNALTLAAYVLGSCTVMGIIFHCAYSIDQGRARLVAWVRGKQNAQIALEKKALEHEQSMQMYRNLDEDEKAVLRAFVDTGIDQIDFKTVIQLAYGPSSTYSAGRGALRRLEARGFLKSQDLLRRLDDPIYLGKV